MRDVNALREALPLRLPVRQRRTQPQRLGVVRAYLDPERALPDGVKERRRTNVGRDAVPEPEAHETGFREDERGVRPLGVVELGEAGVTAAGSAANQ